MVRRAMDRDREVGGCEGARGSGSGARERGRERGERILACFLDCFAAARERGGERPEREREREEERGEPVHRCHRSGGRWTSRQSRCDVDEVVVGA